MNQQLIRDEFISHLNSLIVKKSSAQLFDIVTVNDEIENIIDTFRWLRNNSPQLNESIKNELLNLGLIDTCLWFCKHYFVNQPLGLCILLQFLANFSINHEIVQTNVYDNFHNVLKNFILSSDNSKLLNNSIMLLYNLCLNNSNYRMNVLRDVNVISKIMTHWTQNELEYSKIFLDSIFENSKDFLLVYTNFPNSPKNQLMNLISIWLDHYQDDVSLDVIIALIENCFINCSTEDISSQVVNVLGKASIINKFKFEIQNNTLLLKKLMDLLIVIHERGKNSDGPNNEFSRVKDLSALLDNSDVQTHDRFWFKSDIIRLISNICYNHKEHQNLMRTNNIIPILLECCSFDAKNPLMREWSLFALRNILEGNLDNQNFVANINSVGSIDSESSIMLTDTLRMATINNSISSDTMFI